MPPPVMAGLAAPPTPAPSWPATDQGALVALLASLARAGQSTVADWSMQPNLAVPATTPGPQGALGPQTTWSTPASGYTPPMPVATMPYAGTRASSGVLPTSPLTPTASYPVTPHSQGALRRDVPPSTLTHQGNSPVSSDEDHPLADSNSESGDPEESRQTEGDDHQPTETASGQLSLQECLRLTREFFPKRVVPLSSAGSVPSAPSEFGWEVDSAEDALAPVEHASLAQFLGAALPKPADDALLDAKSWGIGRLLPLPKNPLRSKQHKATQVPGSLLPPVTLPITQGDWRVFPKTLRQKAQTHQLWTPLYHKAATALEDKARKGFEAVSHADALILAAKEAVITPGTRNTEFREEFSPQQVASLLSWAWQAVKTSGTYLASMYADAVLLRRDTLLSSSQSRVERAETARYRTLPLSTTSLFGDQLKPLLEQRSQEERELALHKVALGHSGRDQKQSRKRPAKGQPSAQPPKLQRFDTPLPSPSYPSYRGRGQAQSRGGSFRGRARGRGYQARGKGLNRSSTGHPQ